VNIRALLITLCTVCAMGMLLVGCLKTDPAPVRNENQFTVQGGKVGVGWI
jgi:hypothetical protein